MPFEIPSDLHPDVMPLAFLLGQWHGNGHGDYPTIDAFDFGQELGFSHDGRPFLHYLSRTWMMEDGQPGRPLAVESGFLRVKPENPDANLELLLTHASGFVEIYLGTVDGAKIELQTDAVVRTSTAKEYTAGHRLYGLVDGKLMYAYDMAAVGQELQPHIWATLERG